MSIGRFLRVKSTCDEQARSRVLRRHSVQLSRTTDYLLRRDVHNGSLVKELAYNKSMPNTDFEKLTEERSAATLLRDELCFLIGWTKADNPEIAEKLEKALKMHEEARCQEWL